MINLNEEYIQDVEFLPPESNSLHQIKIFISSNQATCPNWFNKLRGDNDELLEHSAKKIDSFSEYEIKDMVNSHKPAKIYFKVQKWQCNVCYKTFVDPSFSNKYPKNTQCTEDFGDYVVQTLLSKSTLNVEALARDFDVSHWFIEKAIRKYRNEMNDLYRTKPPCSIVWLIPFMYHGTDHMIAFGKTHKSKDNEDLVLLGFCDNYIDYAVKEFELDTEPTKPDIIYAYTQELIDDTLKRGFHCEAFDEGKCPKEIIRLMDIIERFEDEKVRSDFMMFRIEFQNRYRREEIRKQGYGDYLPITVFSYHPGMKLSFDNLRRKQSSRPLISYAASDLTELLSSFDFEDEIALKIENDEDQYKLPGF